MLLLLEPQRSSRVLDYISQFCNFTWMKEFMRLWASFVFSPPVCKGAKADIVFLTDASWSIGDDNFNKVVKFIFHTVGGFDEISPAGIQVGVVSMVVHL